MDERETQRVAFWRRYDAMEARLTRPVSERMLDLAGIAPGMRLLDVACGRGEPALTAAARVGPSGFVLGIDASPGMLAIARERAVHEGIRNVGLRAADAETLDAGEAPFDAATLRWGLMYMSDPERALACVHRALKPGAAFVLASWAEPARVQCMSLPYETLARYRDVPPQDPAGPGMFRDADPTRFDDRLAGCGFRVETSEEMEVPVVEADDGDSVVAWVRALGGPLMELVDELPVAQRGAWERDVAAEAERHRAGPAVRLSGVTRLTLARVRD